MYVVPPRVSETQAERWFRKRRFGAVGRLLRPLFPRRRLAQGVLPRLELIWMPHYLVTIRAKAPDGSEGRLQMSIDAYAGVFMLVKLAGELDEGDPPEALFPPLMSPKEAEAKGRVQLTLSLLRRRGHRDRPTPLETQDCQLFYCPFWTYYYERMPGAIDIVVLDAVSGQKAGARMKGAVLEAFTAASSRKPSE
ncbi:MAG TPA: hypothetical protein PLM14_02120 [Candidatus Hydrogenedentes bacterium]|nr:hypothetical protein [Candidatus Hydrogenedentota bacterium]